MLFSVGQAHHPADGLHHVDLGPARGQEDDGVQGRVRPLPPGQPARVAQHRQVSSGRSAFSQAMHSLRRSIVRPVHALAPQPKVVGTLVGGLARVGPGMPEQFLASLDAAVDWLHAETSAAVMKNIEMPL